MFTAAWAGRIVAAGVALASGAALFLFLYNRWLLLMRDGYRKHIVTRTLIALFAVAPTLGGLWLGPGPWLAAPVGVLVLFLIGELRRVDLRSQCRGAGPVAESGPPVSLRRPFTTLDLHVRRYTLPLPGWTGERFRIVHLSDFHLNRMLPADYYARTMRQAVDCEPDIVLLTGDFVSETRHIPLLPPVLQHLRAPSGVFASLGNHDFWTDPAAVRDALEQAGVTLLGNLEQRVRRPGGGAIVLSGCEDPWNPAPWHAPSLRRGDVLVVLSHTADNIYRLNAAGANVVFAGHYHAGQLVVPGIGPLAIPSRYGRRFDHGHYLVDGSHLYISAGMGVHFPPVRLYCPPDLLVVDLCRA